MPAERVYVAGTCDTKLAELAFVRDTIRARGLDAVLVDLSTHSLDNGADIGPGEVAEFHPGGIDAVFTGDRGSSVRAMTLAFEKFATSQPDMAGIIGLGGSGGTAMISQAMRALPIGIPKIMVSTIASGSVGAYVGASDICMMYSVTDLAGLNEVTRVILNNAANAMAGMVRNRTIMHSARKPVVGLTMFGVTTPCVQQIIASIENDFDPLVFHATGTGGQSMEKLADSHLLAGILDITTTEVCDLIAGGIFPCTEDRFGAVARTQLPYVGSCGALDMVNFGAKDTVPARYRDRNLYEHNSSITLMRTTPEENMAIGRWIGEKLNRCEGEVRFLLPLGGVSLLDMAGWPFHDPEADAALFEGLRATIRQTEKRQLITSPYPINAPEFARLAVEQFRAICNAPALTGAQT